MKRVYLLVFLLTLMFLAACSGDNQEATDEAQTPAAPTETKVSLPSATQPAGAQTPAPYPNPDDSYPAPPTIVIPTYPPGYPEPPTPGPTVDPYPGGLAVIVKAAGIQCEEPELPDLDAALAQLEGAGITVVEAGEIDLMVCEACGCATSKQYRVVINADGMPIVEALGWSRFLE